MDITSITATASQPALTTPATAASAHSSKRLSGAALRNAAPEEQRRQAAAQFEAILVRQMLSASVGSMLGGTDKVAGNVYGDMMTDTLSQKLTEGKGLGFARLVEQQISPRSPSAAAKSNASAQPAAPL
jgi:Rod binding domain-containing protein